jgi:hypothetical protein
VVIIVLGACQLSCISSLEQVAGMFLSPYLVKGANGFSLDTASYVVGISGLAFTFGRFLNIFLTKKVPPKALQAVYTLLVLIGYVMLGYSSAGNAKIVWIAAILTGFGESPVYPLTMSFVEKRVSITNSVQMIIQLSGTFSYIFCLATLGRWIELNVELFVYACWLLCGCVILLFILLIMTDVWKRNWRSRQDNQMLIH